MIGKAQTKKVVIVGGVAGGANAAARLRRLNEYLEIIVLERSGYVSFANCGLPYHIGSEISERESLLLHSPATLRARFNIDTRVRSEVISIDRKNKRVSVRELATAREYTETYDALILAPGAAPFRPAIEGLDLPEVFSLRNVEDMDKIIASFTTRSPKQILVVGGGFIGLEMVEQLHSKFASSGTTLTLVESNTHILAPLDFEMAAQVENHLKSNHITIITGDAITAFRKHAGGVRATTRSGKNIDADFVLFSIGVRPEVALAQNAGLELGPRGGLKVDSQLRTSDPNIYAVGDCIETNNPVTNEYGIIPLAGPANRQGRIVADVINGIDSHYNGTLGTAIVRVFELVVALTGPNERTLERLKIPFKTIHLHPNSHAGYYPGAHAIHLKLIYSPATRKILGAQAIGKEGVDKRIDVLATAIQAGLTVDDLVNLELCYAPPFGSAKDPVNVAGMAAQNVLSGFVDSVTPKDLESNFKESTILDVRSHDERTQGSIPGSLHIPLPELRERLSELSKDKLLIVYCHSGQRSYNACRILMQHGFQCKNLSGAYATWRQYVSAHA